jgi:hypothetical protein
LSQGLIKVEFVLFIRTTIHCSGARLLPQPRFLYFNLWIGIRFVALVLPALLAIATHAQGGPPFITDDPGTPGNHHWKIHFG